jgi:hypothetical protein
MIWLGLAKHHFQKKLTVKYKSDKLYWKILKLEKRILIEKQLGHYTANVLTIRSCNYYGVSLQFFLQPFSIDSADFRCRDPAISSPRSFYGQNICSVCVVQKLLIADLKLMKYLQRNFCKARIFLYLLWLNFMLYVQIKALERLLG